MDPDASQKLHPAGLSFLARNPQIFSTDAGLVEQCSVFWYHAHATPALKK